MTNLIYLMNHQLKRYELVVVPLVMEICVQESDNIWLKNNCENNIEPQILTNISTLDSACQIDINDA